ncbi:MAG: sodium-dependent transporter [Candidatus Marinimicrobia bacterium]|nr:sodium-dependent transporter [Candidatus Neomarinimicrobiota bacterium]
MKEKREEFTYHLGFILTMLGMAIGTGNIWRFPRIVASTGGGAFLIPWTIFLFMWSIPLMILEFSIGRSTKRGVIYSFSAISNGKLTWMGLFVVYTTLSIMFYYSSVTGWCIRYLLFSAEGRFTDIDLPSTSLLFEKFVTGGWQVFFHILAISLAGFIVYKGVVKGIEKANIIFIPSLFLLLLLCLIRVITIRNGFKGIEYLFDINFSRLKDYSVWLEALTQSAWSTGAGWGLVLTYAIYMKKNEDVFLNSLVTGFGNNSASLLAGMVVFGTVFATASSLGEAMGILSISGRGGTGLTFETLPALFAHIPMGYFLSLLFFLGLTFAAMSSLISMVEMGTRIFIDFGIDRKIATLIVTLLGMLFGLPSAILIDFFENQDWVWGMGLILNGLFFSIIVIKYGVDKFRENFINRGNVIRIGKWFEYLIFLIPVQFGILIVWWFSKSIGWENDWWNPLKKYSLATILCQWLLIIFLSIIFNKKIVKLHELEK